MNYSLQYILSLLFGLLLLITGCRSEQPAKAGKSEIINQYDSDHQKQGYWEIYSDSVLIAKGSYTDDRPDGPWIFYYPNGQKKEEGHFKNGNRVGIWAEWYEDGDLMWKGLWENGKRKIEYTGEPPEILFVGKNITDNVLIHDTAYKVRIRVPNVPASHLFVEVKNGSVNRNKEQTDLFILNTANDSILTMVIGYMPDLEFRDFRNLVKEVKFMVK
jgi:antitoxin component YwqK of YwqJK toxin-antitoxin module